MTKKDSKKIVPKDANAIVRDFRKRYIQPELGDGRVAIELVKGLYDVLGGDVLSRPFTEVFEPEKHEYVRAKKVLERLDAETVGDIIKHTEAEILGEKNVGIGTVKYIQGELAKYGLSLKRSDD